jgi:hypothetical protein
VLVVIVAAQYNPLENCTKIRAESIDPPSYPTFISHLYPTEYYKESLALLTHAPVDIVHHRFIP